MSEQLFSRSSEPDEAYSYPLLEGRDVAEFREGPPRLFLNPDPELLRRAGCRLRQKSDFSRASFVVRQTAQVPIAALHSGLPFRNTLLAGFEHPDYRPELVVGLLNSALYRALHLAARRDARQAVFPQVKIGHLRALPRPPPDDVLFQKVEELSRRMTRDGSSPDLRQKLDGLVFDSFSVPDHHRNKVIDFLAKRVPKLYSWSRGGSNP